MTEPNNVAWRTSTYSGPSGGNCIEVGPKDTIVGVRDTRDRCGGSLAVRPSTWRAFVAYAKRR